MYGTIATRRGSVSAMASDAYGKQIRESSMQIFWQTCLPY